MVSKSAINLPVLMFFQISLLSGCANLTHFNEKKNLATADAVFVDAKQRGVYAVQKTNGEGKLEWKGICAEPAPDAISSLASALGLDVSVVDKGKLGLSHSLSEGVGTLGIRTAAIAALRDIMYRNCEAYALGAISELGLETLQRRFQSTMIAILAIEQMTGAVRAPSIIVDSTSSVGNAELIATLTKDTETAFAEMNTAIDAEVVAKESYDKKNKEVEDLEAQLSAKKAQYDEANSVEVAKRTDAQKTLVKEYEDINVKNQNNRKDLSNLKVTHDKSKKIVELRTASYNAINESRTAAIASGGKTAVNVSVENMSKQTTLSDAAVKTISEATVKIVESTMQQDFGKELCVTIIGKHMKDSPDQKNALWACISLLLVPEGSSGDDLRRDILKSLDSEIYKENFRLGASNRQKVDAILSKIDVFDKSKWDILVNSTSINAESKKDLLAVRNSYDVNSLLTNEARKSSSEIIEKLYVAISK